MGSFTPLHWVMLAIILGGYFLPTLIAAVRKHKNTVPIVLINLFAGWTVIGWFGSLIWACISKDKPQIIQVVVNQTPSQN